MKAPTTVQISATVNGRTRRARVAASTTLVDLLRVEFGLTGSKDGCGVGECGACTVAVDGNPTLACLVLAAEINGRAVVTIEHPRHPRLARLRRAFEEEGAVQCGFCTSGMILAASCLPSDATSAQIRAALAGNLCRCTGYTKIVRAVRRAGRDRAPKP
jgi:aerobic-type carbon monoxide dehydrogenase small subunit (CoxS/CutS family)